MSDNGESTMQQQSQLRGVLPRSASIIESFREIPSHARPGQRILATAIELAAHHQRQWHAEDASRAPGASSEVIATNKRLIDQLNAKRCALVEQIDAWVVSQIDDHATAALHTETLGSVVDRMAIAWVRATNLVDADGARDRARLALRQLAELAVAYDDLVRDVANGHRRLPQWRLLKTYRNAS